MCYQIRSHVLPQLEESDRSRIEDIKESERIRTMHELDQWKEQKRLEAEKEKLKLLEIYKSQKFEEKETCENALIFNEVQFEDELASCKITEIEKPTKTAGSDDFEWIHNCNA